MNSVKSSRFLPTLLLLWLCSLQLVATPLTQPDPPELLGYTAPYVIYVCESEWNTFEFSIDRQPDLIYSWNLTEADVLDKFELSADNSRIRLDDPAGLQTLVRIFLTVQAIDQTSCASFPTSITLVLVPEMDIPDVAKDTVCVGRPFILTPYRNDRIASYAWNFGSDAEELSGDSTDEEPFGVKFNSEGEKSLTVSVLDTFGCTTQKTYDYTVFNAPPPPNIQQPCPYLGTDSVYFEWTVDDDFDYMMNIVTVPGTATLEETDTSLLVTGIFPGQNVIIEVAAETDDSPAPCNITSQQARCRSCIPTTINTDNIDRFEFCEGDVLQPQVVLTAGVTTYGALQNDPIEGTWSGVGVVMQGGTALFDPAGLAPGTYDVFYQYIHPDDNCPWDIVVPFFIYEEAEPNASFSETSESLFREICAGESVTVYFDTYDDRPRPDIFWDSTDDITSENRSKTSERVTFPADASGTYEIIVRYGLLGCEDRSDTLTVDVTEKPIITIQCDSMMTDSIGIHWGPITGTASYEVYLDGVSVGIVNDTIFGIGDLMVDQSYELTVEPLALGCSDSGTITCSTGGCVSPTTDFSNLDATYCYNPDDGPLFLDIEILSSRPGFTGSYTWVNPEVDDNNNFFPNPAEENYELFVDYSEGGCSELIFVGNVEVITEPVLDITLSNFDNPDIDTICSIGGQMNLTAVFSAPDPTGMVTYTSTIPPELNPSLVGSPDGDMYLLNPGVSVSGTFVIEMQATYKGCPGPVATKTVVVEERLSNPDVTCQSGYGEISLSWDPVDCATAFRIFLTTDGSDDLVYEGSAQSYTVPLLEEGSMQTYRVEAISNCLCPNSFMESDCMVLTCPDIILEEVPLDTCYNESLPPFEMPINVTESPLIMETGSGEWSGFIINGQGLVAPTSGPGPHQLTYTYTQGSCVETLTFPFEFTEAPTLSITPMDPMCPEDSLGTVIVSVEGGTPGYQYSIDGSAYEELLSFPLMENAGIGGISVEVIDSAGCLISDVVIINPTEEPDFELDGEELIVEGNDAFFEIFSDLDPNELDNISWTLNGESVGQTTTLDTFVLPTVINGGVLVADLTYGGGCSIMDSIEFDVNTLQKIYIPNMVDFSGKSPAPDNEWKAYLKGDEVNISDIKIYNRWGKMLHNYQPSDIDFESNTMDYFKELLIWDGYSGSVPVKQGVYTYVIQTEVEGTPRLRTGSITILR